MDFNPRSRMGSDTVLMLPSAGVDDFNPRSRMGSDGAWIRHGSVVEISIHAPAWGATASDDNPLYPMVISIHAPAWGATSDSADKFKSTLFQSTLPHGERPSYKAASAYSRYFNPRSRMGSDRFMHIIGEFSPISIHAPAWGATSAAPLFTTIN